MTLRAINKRHAQQRRALRALQDYEQAAKVCANRLSARQQARRFRLPLHRVQHLRKVWRDHRVDAAQPWETPDLFVSLESISLRPWMKINICDLLDRFEKGEFKEVVRG